MLRAQGHDVTAIDYPYMDNGDDLARHCQGHQRREL